jgi:hypothetical protein
MAKLDDYVPPIARGPQTVGEVRGGDKRRFLDILKEPPLKVQAFNELPLETRKFYLRLCSTYEKLPDYGKEVRGGWPGVKGKVYFGIPCVDRFGEVLVIYREKEGGALKSRFLGRV